MDETGCSHPWVREALTRYLVLLRGINVGGRNKVPMAALRDLLESHGHRVTRFVVHNDDLKGVGKPSWVLLVP